MQRMVYLTGNRRHFLADCRPSAGEMSGRGGNRAAELARPLWSRGGLSCYIKRFGGKITGERVGQGLESMYAIFEDGSRQYKVSEGQLVTVDYREAEPGTRVELSRVLLYRNGEDFRVGQPVIEGLRVLAEVVDNPSIKLYIQHFRRRKNYRRFKGHRQHYTRLRVKHILLAGQEPPVAPPPAPPAPAATEGTPASAATGTSTPPATA